MNEQRGEIVFVIDTSKVKIFNFVEGKNKKIQFMK